MQHQKHDPSNLRHKLNKRTTNYFLQHNDRSKQLRSSKAKPKIYKLFSINKRHHKSSNRA